MARVSNDDHKQMLELIQKRKAEGVERLVRDHILRGQDVVLEEFDRRRSK
jgi:DNA-binding GntR family transcriptional regulator